MNNKVTINKEQKLYVIPCGKNGFSCYGFENCIKMRNKLAKEYNMPRLTRGKIGTMKTYDEYLDLCELAGKIFAQTGKKSESGLNEKLKGLKGKRVEVVYTWGEKERFYVGQSTGHIPCNLVIKKSNSTGGISCMSDESIVSVKVIY